MSMDGETVCGVVCQHPSCWDAQRRRIRGLSKPLPQVRRVPPPLTEDDDLPKQSIINLLDDYGEDPADRYPTRQQGANVPRGHTKDTVARTLTRQSFPKVHAPNATPASQRRSLTGITVSSKEEEKPVRFSKVEVQEVYDLEDLHSAWQETFQPKQYYVWVPRPTPRKEKPRIASPPAKLPRPRDVTEAMVPREIEWQRELSVLFKEVWPLLKKKQQLYRDSSPQNSAQVPRPTYRVSRMENQGLYELLDLPRDVLLKVLEHMDQRDLSDRQKLAETLLHILPLLEKENNAIALANSNVLLQRKMHILDSREKPGRLDESFRPKQIFLLDKDDLLEQLSAAQEPQSEDEVDPDRMTDLSDLASSIYPESLQDGRRMFNTMNRRHPLPAIIGKHGTKSKTGRITNISLGLPEIPSGVRITRPFDYSHQLHDFTLGRIPTPPRMPERRVTSAPSEERSSTIHVTVPSVPSDGGDGPDAQEQEQQSMPKTAAQGSSQTANMPKTPAVTPAHLAGSGKAGQEPIQAKPAQGVSPEHTGFLGPIPESQMDSPDPALSRNGSRSVHFSGVPPQPPSSPTESYVESRQNSMMSRGGGAGKSSTTQNSDEKSLNPSPAKSSVVSPESWPNLENGNSMAVNIDSTSEKSLLNPPPKPQVSLVSNQSNQSALSPQWGERHLESPAPPPPSPEVKDTVGSASNSGGSQHTVQLAILQEASELESEMTLSVAPPSNLDDISRINTPCSNALSPAFPDQSVMRKRSAEGEDLLAVCQEEEQTGESADKQDESHREVTESAEASQTVADEGQQLVEHTGDQPDQATLEDHKHNSTADMEQDLVRKEGLQNGENVSTPAENVSTKDEKQEVSDRELGEPDQNVKLEQEETVQSSNTGGQEAAQEGIEEVDRFLDPLDQFDTSEADYRAELQEEYVKLSQDSSEHGN